MKQKSMFFLKFSCFFYDLTDVGKFGLWFLCHFKSSLNIWKFSVHVLLKHGLENFEHYFASTWNECNCVVVWTFFEVALLWDWNENGSFPVHCWVFQICWHIECNTFTVPSFRIWKRATGIPSPPLALFVVMLPKAHLTSHSRMSGSRWVIILPRGHTIMVIWVMKIFFGQFFCVFLPPHLSVFCFCQVHTISVLYWAHLCMKCSLQFSSVAQWFLTLCDPLVSLIFLKRSLVLPILLLSSISLHCSLRRRFSLELLLIFGTLHSNWYIFPFLLCL